MEVRRAQREVDELHLEGQAVLCEVWGERCVYTGSPSLVSYHKAGWARSEVWVSWVEDAIRKRKGLQRPFDTISKAWAFSLDIDEQVI